MHTYTNVEYLNVYQSTLEMYSPWHRTTATSWRIVMECMLLNEVIILGVYRTSKKALCYKHTTIKVIITRAKAILT